MDRRDLHAHADLDARRIAELTDGLRRLARSLVVCAAEAEDLVQEAWMAALRSPPADSAKLGGWLGRTLRNLAVDRRIAAARRLRRESEVRVRGESGEPEADQIETLQSLLAELQGLEEPFRTAVRMRFLEGEPPRRIASRLGVPVGTVHSRIQRGLERIRERLAAREGKTRGAWLAALLPVVRPTSSLAASTLLTGVLLMKMQAVAVLLALCGVGAFAYWWQGDSEIVQLPAAAESVAGGKERQTEVDRTAIERAPVPDVPTGASAPAVANIGYAAVRGRCLDAETGLPLAGVLATFDGADMNRDQVERHAGAAPWADPAPVLTAEDGRFEFLFRPHPAKQHGLTLEFEGFAPRTGRWGPFEADQLDDLGDVQLQRGHRVGGQVLDEEGAPVAGLRVSLGQLPLPVRAGMGAGDSRGGVTGGDGRFTVSAAIPAGTWPLSLYGDFFLNGPGSVTVPLREPLSVRVTRQRRVRGRVVDATTGEGILGITLRARSAAGAVLRGAGTDRQGRFEIRQSQPGDDPPSRIDLLDPSGRYLSATREQLSAWGQSDLRFPLHRAGVLRLEVVDEQTGEPVERFAVRMGAGNVMDGDARRGGVHPAGRVELSGLEPGPNLVVVLPSDADHLISRPMKVDFDGVNPVALRVALPKALEVPVRVVGRDELPVKGARVELIDPGTEPESFGAQSLVLERAGTVRSAELFAAGWRLPTRFSRLETDREGAGTLLFDPRFDEQVALRVVADGYGPMVRLQHVVPGQPCEIVLVPSARVVGSLVAGYPADSNTLLQIGLEDLDREGLRNGLDTGPVLAELESDGKFAFEELPEGRLRLLALLSTSLRWGGGGTGQVLRWRQPLAADLSTRGGATVQLGTLPFDFTPARVRGQILVGDRAPSAARIWFEGEGEASWDGTLGTYAVDADGTFDVAALPPGSWRPFVATNCEGSRCGSVVRAAEVLHVRAGQSMVVDVRIPTHSVRIAVVDAEGRPAAGVRLRIRSTASLRPFEQSSDSDGVVVLDPAPLEALSVQVDHSTAGWVGAPLNIPAAAADGPQSREATFVVRPR